MYLFPNWDRDETVRGLLEFSKGRLSEIGDLHASLIAFACESAYTDMPAREYAVRALLRDAPRNAVLPGLLPYLRADVERVYRAVFDVNWDERCAGADLLPLPRFRAVSPPGETGYRAAVAAMVSASSPDALCRLLLEFWSAYASEGEAMYRAFTWDGHHLRGVARPEPAAFEDLQGLEHQKQALIANAGAFLAGRPANDVLLSGGSGTGKSTCVKALLNHFAEKRLKLAELPGASVGSLGALLEVLGKRQCRYLVFIDDLSFERADASYLALKVALEGRAEARPGNVLFCVTSNRRHLICETWQDRDPDGEIHENDTRHEKLSLADRFGLRLVFPLLSREEFYGIVQAGLQRKGAEMTVELRRQASVWADTNGLSGRSASQFVKAVTGA